MIKYGCTKRHTEKTKSVSLMLHVKLHSVDNEKKRTFSLVGRLTAALQCIAVVHCDYVAGNVD